MSSYHSAGSVSSANAISLRILAHYPEPGLPLTHTSDCRGVHGRDRIFTVQGMCRLLDYRRRITYKHVYSGIIIAAMRHKIWLSSDSSVCPGRPFHVP